MMSATSNENILRRNAESDEVLKEYHDSGQYVSHENMEAWLGFREQWNVKPG